MTEQENKMPDEGNIPKIARGTLQIAGAVPFAGGLFSAAAGYWSEHEQEKVNTFLKDWMMMLRDEMREKEKTILEIMSRFVALQRQVYTCQFNQSLYWG